MKRKEQAELIEYIRLQQGLRQPILRAGIAAISLIEYIPLQQGLRQTSSAFDEKKRASSLSIFHYNKD